MNGTREQGNHVEPHPPLRAEARWWLLAVLAFMTASYAAVVLLAPSVRAPFLRERVAAMPLAVYMHISGGAAALMLGAFQLNAAVRSSKLAIHRWMGRAYLVSVLLGGCAGLALATVSQGRHADQMAVQISPRQETQALTLTFA